MKVALPIFWHTDETKLIEELGIDSKSDDDFEGYDKREVIFYQISGITKYQNKDLYTRIYANGDMFVCSLPLNKVEKLIDNG